MRVKETEIGIIVNQKAGSRQDIDQTLKAISESFENARTYDIRDLENGNIQNIPPTVVVIGGDGTVRASISWLVSHDEYPQILIAGGGSTNTFRSALIKEGTKTSVKAVKNNSQRSMDYKPATIEHEDGQRDMWVIAAGFGEFERDFTTAFEGIRRFKIPPKTKAHTAGLLTLLYNFLTAMSTHDSLLQTYTTCRNIGPFKVFKENELSLSSNKLGLVKIDKKDYYRGLLRFIISSMFWQAGAKPPKSLVQTMIGESFMAGLPSSEKMSRINLDGDERYIKSGQINLKRHPQSFPTAALIWERK